VKDELAECYAQESFPHEEDREDSNVIHLNTWANSKAQSRYANA
jgi:hypothetical protein